MIQTELLVPSTLDGTMQPSLFYKAKGEHRPLLVGLHTWSFDRFNQINNMLPYAEKYDFHLLLPEFRGNNLESSPNCTQACGSIYAKQDIRDAIDHVLAAHDIDRNNIFLLGNSGGGHMAMLMAGFCPTLFKAIGAFVPITDLEVWAGQNPDYRPHVLACTGGSREEMALRSPMTYMDTIAQANLKLFHGKYDPVVPVSHSLDFFSRMQLHYPTAHIYLDIFDGGHEMDMEAAFHWFLSQYRGGNKQKVTG